MLRYFIAFLCLYTFPVYVNASEKNLQEASQIASTAGIVSSIINGSVSAISGDFIDCEVDLVIPGAEPLVIQRSYTSSEKSTSFIHCGWRLSSPQELCIRYTDARKKNYQVFCGDPCGCLLHYKKIPKRPKFKGKTIELWPDVTKGMTNASFGEISGHTNLKNRFIEWKKIAINDNKRETFEIFDGKGAHRLFKEDFDNNNNCYFIMQWEKKPNGNQSLFSYSMKPRTLEGITTANLDDVEYGKVDISGLEQEPDKDHTAHAYFTTSDNRILEYRFSYFKNFKHSTQRNYLTAVIRPSAPRIYYDYTERDQSPGMLISKKDLCDGRYLINEYYHEGANLVLNEKLYLKADDNRIDRVNRQYAPIGPGAEPVLAYSYFYEIKSNGSGTTKAYDALGHCTSYEYDKNFRLIRRKFYKGQNKNILRHCSDSYVWYTSEEDEGNLHAHLFNGAKNTIRARVFKYDVYGNIIREKLFGNMTGTGSEYVELDEEGLPNKESCETYAIGRIFTDDATNLLLAESEYNGKSTTFEYYPETQLLKTKHEKYNDTIYRSHFYSYDRYGNIVSHSMDTGTDPSVRQTLIKKIVPKATTPAMGLPESQIDLCFNYQLEKEEQLRRRDFSYDEFGRVTAESIFDAQDNPLYVLTKCYDKYNHIVEETDALGKVTSRKYDKHNNLTYYQGPRRDSYAIHTYDCSNRLTNTEEFHPGLTFVTKHAYDLLGNRIATTDKFGNTTRYLYNEFGAITKIIGPPTPNEVNILQEPETSYEYDESGNMTKMVDPLGRITSKTYQMHGKPTSITYPDGSCEKFIYRKDGTLAKSIAKNGLETIYTHDCYGNELVQEEIAPDGTHLGVTHHIYNGFICTSKISPMGHTTSFRYDSAGRLIEEIKNDKKTTHAYDSIGRRCKTCEWYGDGETDYTAKFMIYDLLDRITEERSEDTSGNVLSKTNYAYDANNNKIQVICEIEGNVSCTYTEFNSLNQPVYIIDANQNKTRFIYDYQFVNENGQKVLQIKKIDAMGNQAITTMDVTNREAIIETQNSFGMTTSKKSLHYDLVGNLVHTIETVISPNEADRYIITRRLYDSMNHCISLIEAFNTPDEKITHFYYNKAGQKESMVKPDGVRIYYHYDGKGRLTHQHSSEDKPTIDYHFTYDLEDHLTAIEDRVYKTTTNRIYDRNTRLIEETLGNGLCLQYSYDRQGRPQKLIMPDQSFVEMHYDALYMRQIDRFDSLGNLKYRHRYLDYDLSGNLTKSQLICQAGQLESHVDSTKRPLMKKSTHWEIHAKGYDACNNLLGVDIKDPLETCQTTYTYDDLYQISSEKGQNEHTYVHDSIFNRVQKNQSHYQHNVLNQLVSTSEAEFRYDKNGNMIARTQDNHTTQYLFDALNRLIEVIDENQYVTYLYDSFNRRLKKTLYEKSDGQWQISDSYSYIYQGDNEIGAYQNQLLTEFRVLGIGKGAEIGATIALELHGRTFTPIHDLNGNLCCLVDAETNQVAEFYRYNAFGEEFIYNDQCEQCHESQVGNPWRFASKRMDEETHFIYFGRRFYAPDIGRWIAPDPLGSSAGPNLYAYVSNSPLMHIDLYGLIGLTRINTYQDYSQFPMIGNALNFWGTHCVPIPYLQDVFCMTGHLLCGKKLSEYQSPGKAHSAIRDLELPNTYNKLSIGFYNGMLNDAVDAKNSAIGISQLFNNANIYYTHDASHGFGRDVFGAVVHKFGVPTREVGLTYDQLKQQIADVGGTGSGGTVLAFPHSKGASNLSLALQRLTKDEREMIHVHAFAPAKIIDKNAAGLVRNYISTRDIVPLISDPYEYVKAKLFGSEHVIFLDSNDSYFIDHPFDTTVYSEQRNNIANDYKEKYR